MRVLSSKQPRRRAAAAVEAAIVLPQLFILLFGVWEVSQLIWMNQIISNGAREGARQASTGNIDASASTFTVQTYVANYLQNAGLAVPANTVTITVTNQTQGLSNAGSAKIDSINQTLVDVTQVAPASSSDPVLSANQGDLISVTVSYPFDAGRIAPVNAFFFLGYFNVTATAEWQCLKDTPITVNSTIPGAPLQ